MDELVKAGLNQGLGYGLFVFLLLYVLKTTGDREKNYQKIINELTGILPTIKQDVEEIKNKIFK